MSIYRFLGMYSMIKEIKKTGHQEVPRIMQEHMYITEHTCKNKGNTHTLGHSRGGCALFSLFSTQVTYSCPTGMVFANLSSTVEVECEESSRDWTTIDTAIFICRTSMQFLFQ